MVLRVARHPSASAVPYYNSIFEFLADPGVAEGAAVQHVRNEHFTTRIIASDTEAPVLWDAHWRKRLRSRAARLSLWFSAPGVVASPVAGGHDFVNAPDASGPVRRSKTFQPEPCLVSTTGHVWVATWTCSCCRAQHCTQRAALQRVTSWIGTVGEGEGEGEETQLRERELEREK